MCEKKETLKSAMARRSGKVSSIYLIDFYDFFL